MLSQVSWILRVKSFVRHVILWVKKDIALIWYTVYTILGMNWCWGGV